jgi:membrane-bound lytic murein transglycosylase MltF
MEKSLSLSIKTVFKNLKSGTYSNDEYVKFNEEIKVVQKKLMDFQTQKNMQAMNTAQQAKDTAVINKLMKGYTEIQAEVMLPPKQNIQHMLNHILNHISVF